MSIFYNLSDKELLNIRNEVFKKSVAPEIEKQGFSRSPFSTSWYGRNNLNDFDYEFCRLNQNAQLEILSVDISRGDRWIKIQLNIFDLRPRLDSLDALQGLKGTKFFLPPNSTTQMRLRSDDYRGIPLFYMLFCPEHKIGSYWTKRGFERRVGALQTLIRMDMQNIDAFVKRWHEIHKPFVTNWVGELVE
jgi:hypothetical protein